MKNLSLKKLFVLNNERGFVLIEFVIALPLIIMLLYGLTETTLQIFRLAKSQAADYVLEVEAQDVLTRITQDARAAQSVERKIGNIEREIDTLIIKYHAIKPDDRKIIDVIDTRVYKVGGNYKIQAKRQDDDSYLNPITGGNFFGDTSVIALKFTKPAENVLHITLEMTSLRTDENIKLSTAVFMPACEEMKGF